MKRTLELCKLSLLTVGLLTTAAQAEKTSLPSELRLPADHTLKKDQIPLGAPEITDAQRAAEFSDPPQMTSCYRDNPSRDGTVRTAALSVDLKLDWKVPFINLGIHSASKSSPAVDSTGIYVGSDSAWLYAYDRDGRLRWRRFAPDAAWGIHSTAALDQKKVYFSAYNGVTYALDKKTGRLLWSTKLGDLIGSSPVISGGALYTSVEKSRPPNGYVAKISPFDGSVIWRSPDLGEQAHSSPVLNEKDGLLHVGANNGDFFGIDLQTGQVRWKFSEGRPIKDTAALVGRSVCFGSWSGKFYCLEASSGKKIWQAQLDSKSRTSPTYIPDLDYLITASESGTIYALKLADGSVAWQIKTGINLLISSSLALKDSKKETAQWIVWDSCEKYSLCAIDAKSGSILKKYDMGGFLTSVPVYFENRLYLSLNLDGGLEAFEAIRDSTKKREKTASRP